DYFHPNRMKRIVDGRLTPYSEPEIEQVPRTALPPAYYRDGAIYAARAGLVVDACTLMGPDCRPVVHDEEFFVNIDNEKDWAIAEWLAPRWLTRKAAAA